MTDLTDLLGRWRWTAWWLAYAAYCAAWFELLRVHR